MTTRVIVSSAAGERLDAAASWLAAQGRCTDVVIVGGNRAAADDLVRRVAIAGGATLGWVRTTATQLAVELALPELGRQGRSPVGRTACEALVARLVHSSRQAGALGIYERVVDGPGLARALASTIEELRHAGLTAEDVEPTAPDLARILDGYRAELEASGFVDRAEVLRVATGLLAGSHAAHAWLDRPTLLLDVRISNEAECGFLSALVGRSPSVLATAPLGDERTDRFLSRVYEVEPEIARRDDDSALCRLQRHLFEQHGPDERSADGTVRILSAPGEGREAVEIARQLLELSRQGTPFDQVAVALRSPEEYVGRLEEAFGRAGIPAYFSRGVVRPHPSGRAFVSLIDCAIEGLSARRFAEYVSLGQVPDGEAGAQTPPLPDHEMLPASLAREPPPEGYDEAPVENPEDLPVVGGSLRLPRRWERLLSDAAVIGGLDRWRERLTAAEGRLRADLEARDRDGGVRERIESDLAALVGLRAFAIPLLEGMAKWPAAAGWAEWLDLLAELAAKALRRPTTVLEALAELEPLGAIGPVGLDEIRLVLARRLLAASIPPPASRYGRVLVAPIDALRGSSFEVVFVPGMAERLFPRKIAEDPILLDRARHRITSELRTNENRLNDERLLLRLAVGAARSRLVLSYPRLDLAQGRPRVPSFYVLEALRACEGSLPTFGELASRAERETEARVGWPAPRDPQSAIDEAEHDLALLENLRSRKPEEKVGTARFLLDANPHLGRALRFRARRWLKAWTPADGLVRPSPAAMRAREKHQLAARSYSPTALEKFASCPYRFFLHTVHRLAPREVADYVDDLDPLRRGSLVHDTQFVLFEQLRDSGLLPITPDRLSEAPDVLDRCLDRCAAELREQLLPRIERVWQDAVQSIRADLREWLRRVCEDNSGYVPWRFELAFGLSDREGRDEHSVEQPAALDCGIRLRGSIDLVERRNDGRLRATDHKTGRARMPSRGVIAGGSALQPVLYALALEKLYAEAEVESGRLYYCTSTGGFEQREIGLDRAARQAADDLGRIVGEALETPFLPAAPERGACEWCDYRVVCGPYEEIRTSRKPRKKLERLAFLRSLP